jgi:hypothetical protein
MFGLSGRQLFILLMLVALLFAGSQYVPGYFNAIQFNDFIRQEVKFAVASKKSPDTIRSQIMQKATELGIPDVKKNDIRITRRGPSFTLELDYHWPINLRVYQHDLTFHVSESGEVFENAPN